MVKKAACTSTLLILIAVLAACINFPSTNTSSTPAPEITLTPTAITLTVATPPVEATPQTLRIWLPPEFDPAAGTPAGDLLQARLDDFNSRRPDLNVEVRIKVIDGQASLLNALISAKQTAPSALPDLIALPASDLETAVLGGLVSPIDGLTTLLDDPDWFGYARELAHIQNTVYGLPFAADALGLLYHPQPDNPLPTNWETLLEENSLLFPADDPQALFSLCLYLSTNNPLQNEEGQLNFAQATLTDLLTFYQSDFISPGVTQYQNNDQTREAYNTSNIATVTWATQYLDDMPVDSALIPVPGLGEESCSLATTWLWALAGSSPDMQPVAVELAEFLSDSEFLATWTAAAGVLPPRPTALDAWPENSTKFALREISRIAHPVPSADVLQTLGPIFRDAAMSVLQEQASPSEAAQTALERLQ